MSLMWRILNLLYCRLRELSFTFFLDCVHALIIDVLNGIHSHGKSLPRPKGSKSPRLSYRSLVVTFMKGQPSYWNFDFGFWFVFRWLPIIWLTNITCLYGRLAWVKCHECSTCIFNNARSWHRMDRFPGKIVAIPVCGIKCINLLLA